MLKTRLVRTAVVAAITCFAGLLLSAPATASSHAAAAAPRGAEPAAAAGPTAPTNLQVTRSTPTSVTLRWDHSQGATAGCTIPIVLYSVYVDRNFFGWTYLGTPTARISRLEPGTTYELTVQGIDNCSGRRTPFSSPLIVTTPAA